MKPGVPNTLRAEQALLGAVLSDPAGQAHLLDLVGADDMTRPYHAQVLEAMQRLRGRGVAPGPLAVHEEVKNDPDMPRDLAYDGVVLADLMEASPRSAHAPAYAAMVISTGIRQRIDQAAIRLKQAARSGDPAAAQQMAANAERELDRSRVRWNALPESMRHELVTPSPPNSGPAAAARQLRAVRDEIHRLRQDLLTGPQHELEDQLATIARHVAEAAAVRAAQRAEPAPMPPASEASQRSELAGTRILRSLVADPTQIAAVRDWLRPADFARPADGDLYGVIRDLHAAGKPIDPLTVTWQASRRGIHTDAAELTGGTGAFAVASAREVHRQGTLARTAKTAQAVQASANDATMSVIQLLRSADDHLSHIEPIAGREDPQPAPRQRRLSQRTKGAQAARHPTPQPDPEHAAEALP